MRSGRPQSFVCARSQQIAAHAVSWMLWWAHNLLQVGWRALAGFFGIGRRNHLRPRTRSDSSVPATALKLPRSVISPVLAVALVVSALLSAAALRSPNCHWLAWFSFLPLFISIRLLRPAAAALSGAMWGACLYLFCTAVSMPCVPGINPSPTLLGSLILIPAVYAGLAALPARAIGFKLVTLALGWTLIEAVVHLHRFHELQPLSSLQGLLAGASDEGPHLHWFVRLLGCVCAAFLVACANESLAGILGVACLHLPASRSLAALFNVGASAISQTTSIVRSRIFCQAYPRAPPIMLAAPSGKFMAIATIQDCRYEKCGASRTHQTTRVQH